MKIFFLYLADWWLDRWPPDPMTKFFHDLCLHRVIRLDQAGCYLARRVRKSSWYQAARNAR